MGCNPFSRGWLSCCTSQCGSHNKPIVLQPAGITASDSLLHIITMHQMWHAELDDFFPLISNQTVFVATWFSTPLVYLDKSFLFTIRHCPGQFHSCSLVSLNVLEQEILWFLATQWLTMIWEPGERQKVDIRISFFSTSTHFFSFMYKTFFSRFFISSGITVKKMSELKTSVLLCHVVHLHYCYFF